MRSGARFFFFDADRIFPSAVYMAVGFPLKSCWVTSTMNCFSSSEDDKVDGTAGVVALEEECRAGPGTDPGDCGVFVPAKLAAFVVVVVVDAAAAAAAAGDGGVNGTPAATAADGE